MNVENKTIVGHLLLTLRSPEGVLVAERRARNVVVRGGAEIVARRFAGVPDGAPINEIRVGFGLESVDPEAVGLTPPPPEAGIPAEDLRSNVLAEQFTIETGESGFVRVRVAAVFSPNRELENVSEAGLFAGDKLYNQVVFEPVTLRPEQDVTFFWEIDFPFGH